MDELYLNQLRSRLDPSYHASPPLPLPVADNGSSTSLLHPKQEKEDEEVVISSGLESQTGSTVPLTEESTHTGEQQPNLETGPKRRKKQRRKTKRKKKEDEVDEEEGTSDIVDSTTQPLEGVLLYTHYKQHQ